MPTPTPQTSDRQPRQRRDAFVRTSLEIHARVRRLAFKTKRPMSAIADAAFTAYCDAEDRRLKRLTA